MSQRSYCSHYRAPYMLTLGSAVAGGREGDEQWAGKRNVASVGAGKKCNLGASA